MNPEGQQGGYILLPVMFTLMLVATVAFMMNHEAGMGARGISSELEAARARYVAEAGLQHALWQTKQQGCGPYTDLTNVAFGNDEYDTQLTHDLGSTTNYSALTDQDAWIRSDQPAVNNATDTKLHIRFEGGVVERPLYRYDLSSIPAQATILSAKAYFYVSKEHPEGPVDMHLVTAAWSEADATWDSMGSSIDQAVLASIPAQPLAGGWVNVNLTGQVQAWVNGVPNYGLTLNSTSEGTHGDYASRESATESYIEVIVGNPPTSPAMLKATSKTDGGAATVKRKDVVLHQSPSSYTRLSLNPGAGQDAMLNSFYNLRNYGDHELQVSIGSGSVIEKSLLQFKLPAIPSGAKIISARLELYHSVTIGTPVDPGVEVHRLTRSWVEGSKDGTGTADGATWDRWDGSSNWTQSGGDYDAAPVASSAISTSTDDWENWEIGELVQGWVDGTFPNHGLILTGTGVIDVSFASQEDADPALHPRISISFTCACGQICVAPQGSGNILFVVANEWALTAGEQAKKSLFESWGYTVNLITQWEVYWNYDAKAANNDVVYISEAVDSTAWGMAPKLAATTLGVVSEEGALNDELGLASGFAWPVGNSITVTDASHYITQLFAAGDLRIFAGDMQGLTISGTAAGGLQSLADMGGAGGLVVLDTGADLYGGGTAPGRRVMLPIGRDQNDFNWDYLNSNGRLIVQRAIEWGMGNDPGASPQNLLLVAGESVASANELARIALIESWGYVVNLIADHDSQVNFDTAVAANNVVYVSQEVRQNELGSKLTDTTIGIVNEDKDFPDDFGFADGTFSMNNQTELDIVENTHYITSPFPIGPLTFGSSQAITVISNTSTVAPDLQVPATVIGAFDVPAVSALESGATTWEDGTAAGRRVLLPWGSGTFDITGLNADGQTLTRRAIEWAAGADSGASTLIGHWMLDDGSGLTAIDSSGNGNDGTLTDSTGPVWTTGTLAGALDFDGSNDYVNVPHDDTLSLTTFSISAWIRLTAFSGSWQTILVKTTTPGKNAYYFGVTGDEIGFGFYNSGFVDFATTSANLSTNRWYHVAATFDDSIGEGKIYLDGILRNTGTTSKSPLPNNDALTIGGNYLGEHWNGELDDIRIYDEVLSSAEIADLATAGAGGIRILYVVKDPTTLGSEEAARQALMQGWGFTVILIDDDDTQDNFDTAAAANDVALISQEILEGSLGTKLVSTTIGVVNESKDMIDEFGFASGLSMGGGMPTLNVDFSHYITSVFSTNTVVPYVANEWYQIANEPLAAGVDPVGAWVEAPWTGKLALMTLSVGADVLDGRTAAGRRVQLPWGSGQGATPVANASLSDDARTIIKRSLEWAAGTDSGGGSGGGEPPSEPFLCGGNYRDDFNEIGFTGTDGSIDWSSSPWVEGGESDGAAGGDVRVLNDVSNYQLRLKNKNNSLEREVDLSGANSATLSFDYRRQGLDNSNDYVFIAFSKDGGSFSEFTRIDGSVKTDGSYQSFSQDMSAHISGNTRIKLQSSSKLGAADEIWFDNIQIQCTP